MFRRILATLLVVAVAAVLALVAWPELLGLQRAPFLALAVSFRGGAVVAAVVLAVLLTAVGLVLHGPQRLLGALALVLLAFAVAVSGVQLTRGVGAPDVPVAQRYDVTVLSWNTLGDSVPAQVIARAARENRATVVALPETTEDRARQVARLLGDDGADYRVFSSSQQEGIPARSTSLLVSTSLGEYRRVTGIGDTHDVPSLVVDAAAGQNAPRIVAVHTLAPYALDPVGWRADLAWAAARCSERNVLMAGDFNATLDHFAGLGTPEDQRSSGPGRSGGQLRACRDGALATGNAAVGTWPTSMPGLIGTPIDHVLATPNWRFTGFRVLSDEDAAGSDHRPVLARLRPAG
ncbi:endonuclease/exonuclease/phosphatase family protein [Amnibacterium soli]|uniref:Endonuclease/exonuclease/phosphatase family protein n=1 Tax=Amnibacterium soli TaxID=1282736 RepID=A0ABP8YRU4_9MICO